MIALKSTRPESKVEFSFEIEWRSNLKRFRVGHQSRNVPNFHLGNGKNNILELKIVLQAWTSFHCSIFDIVAVKRASPVMAISTKECAYDHRLGRGQMYVSQRALLPKQEVLESKLRRGGRRRRRPCFSRGALAPRSRRKTSTSSQASSSVGDELRKLA